MGESLPSKKKGNFIMGNIIINAKGQKVNGDGLTFEEFAKKKLAERKTTTNVKGQTVNRDGLTFDEFATLKIYERDKKAGKITQNYNAAQINSGLSRDKFDSRVRGGSKTGVSPEKDQKEFYSMPEKLTNNTATEATEQKLDGTKKVYDIYGKLISGTSEKIEAHDKRLSELERELGTLGADYSASPSAAKASAYNAKYDELVSLQNERNSLAEKYNSYISETKDLGQLYSSYVSEFNAQNKELLEEYNQWRSTVRESDVVMNDISAIDKAIKELEKELTREFNPIEFIKKQADQEWRKPIEEKLAALRSKKLLLEEELEASEALYYSDMMSREDFAEKSKYKSTKNGKEARTAWGTNIYIETGYDDIIYEIINGREKDAAVIQNTTDVACNVPQKHYYLQFFYEEEKAIYNYLYATNKEEADKFVEDLTPTLNARMQEKNKKEWSEYAENDAVGSSIFSVILSLGKPYVYFNQLLDYFEDGKIEHNAAYNNISIQSSEIRKTVSSNFGTVGSFAYNIGMSMADNLFTLAATGGMSKGTVLAILGTSAAADSTIAAKERGLSDSQAIALGTLTGATEIITEKIGLDALLDKIGKGKGVLLYLLKNAFAEGGEEMSSEVLTTLSDILVAGNESEWRKQIKAYMDKGCSEGEAFAKALGNKAGDTLLSGLAGFLSGGAMGGMFAGGSATIKTIKKIDHTKNVKKIMKDVKAQEALIADGLNFPKDSAGYKLAEKIDADLKAGKTPKMSDLVKLEEYWELVDDAPKLVAELAKEGKTLDQVKGHLRELGISDKVVTDKMIEDAYNNKSGTTSENEKAEQIVTEEMKPGEINTKYSFSNINENDSDKQFSDIAELIDNISDEGAKRRNSQRPYVLVSKNTPQILKDSGANDLPVIMRFDAMYLAERTDGVYPKEDYHYHGLGKDIISKLPQHLSNPDLILETKGKDGKTRLVEIISIPTKSGEMLVSVELDTVKDIGGENTPYNMVLTAFDIKQRYFNQLFKKQNATVKYQKEALTQVNPQLHEWLSTVNASASTDSISENGENVKTDVKNSSEDDLDAPYESEITKHKREIGETNRVYEHKDPARQRFYADLYEFKKALEAKGQLEGHKIMNVRTDTERSGIVYGASQTDIDIAVRLSKALGRDIMYFS